MDELIEKISKEEEDIDELLRQARELLENDSTLNQLQKEKIQQKINLMEAIKSRRERRNKLRDTNDDP